MSEEDDDQMMALGSLQERMAVLQSIIDSEKDQSILKIYRGDGKLVAEIKQ